MHLESEEAPMEKIVPLFKPYKTIFYFKKIQTGKVPFGSSGVWTNLNKFDFVGIH
jgi:hypothetical protein